jgi:hypothetical protein
MTGIGSMRKVLIDRFLDESSLMNGGEINVLKVTQGELDAFIAESSVSERWMRRTLDGREQWLVVIGNPRLPIPFYLEALVAS